MEKNFVFPSNQRSVGGGILVCSCCNEVLAQGAERLQRGGHEVHEHCAKKFDAVMGMKPELAEIFAEVPGELLKEQYLGDRLERACTIGAIRTLVTDFCRLVEGAAKKLGRLVDSGAVAAAKEELILLVKKISEPLKKIGARVQLQPHQIDAYLAI